jgi:L-lactate dehydrogenase complex protein LldG
MSTVSTFEESLSRLDVELTTTTVEGFADALASIVEPPAVGARLPFEGVSLPESVPTDPTPADLEAAVTGVSPASLAVADYGSVVLPATADGAEQVSLFPELHVPVVQASDVVDGMPAAVGRLGEEFRDGRGSAIVATGPSATADMGALVRGAHGPTAVHVVVLEDR